MISKFSRFRNRTISFYFVYAILLISLAACDDENNSTDLGLGILPATDTFNIRAFDTLTVKTFTERSNPIETSDPRYSPFGYYNDPIFGSTKAEFVTEFAHLGSDTIEGESLTADSIVMFVDNNGYYGDPSASILMEAYLINDGLPEDSLQYSDYDPSGFDDLTKIGSGYFQANQSQIKYYFDPEFGEMLINPATIEGDTTYLSRSGFKEKFKGLLFRTAPVNGNGAVALLNLYSYVIPERVVPTRIIMYYHHMVGDSVAKEQIAYSFEGDLDAHFNMYEHDYSQSDFAEQLETNQLDSVVYLQSMAGTNIRMSIPELSSWASPGEVAINSALLTIHLEDFDKTVDFLSPPANLGLKVVYPDGSEEMIEDLQTQSLDYFRGNVSQNTYVFNMSKHVQAVVDGAENADLLIYPVYLENIQNNVDLVDNYILPTRVVLAGSKNSSPVKLDIIYTIL